MRVLVRIGQFILPALLLCASMVDVLLAEEQDGARLTNSPVSRDITYEDLVNLVDIGISSEQDFTGLAISPDGRAIAFEQRRAILENNNTMINWVILELSSSPNLTAAGDGGDPIPDSPVGKPSGYSPPQIPKWAPSSQAIAYLVRRNGETQLWTSSRTDGRQKRITNSDGDVRTFFWSRDGQRLLFGAGKARSLIERLRRDERARGYIYDARFAPIESLAPGEADDGVDSVWVHDLLKDEERLATPKELAEYTSLGAPDQLPRSPHATWIRRSKAGMTAWLDVPSDGRRSVRAAQTVFASRSADGSDPIECRSSICGGHFKGLWLSPDGTSVYFLRWANTNTYGSLALHRWIIGSLSSEEILKTGDLLEGCAQQAERLICAHESSTTPRKLVTLDLKTGALQTLHDPNPHFAEIRFGTVQPYFWQTPSAIEGFGHLVLPTDNRLKGPYPLVVVQYRSRGFLRGGVGDEYPIHILAARGFAVLSFHRPDDIELEAHSQTYDEVETAGWTNFRDRRLVQSVLEAGLDSLERAGVIDARRVGITGLSDGGETLAFELIHSPRRFAAASASWTFWNPIVYFLAGPQYQPRLQSFGLGNPTSADNLDRWREISIGLNAHRVRAPLLMQVSDSELQAETQTFTALSELRRPVEMHVYPDEYHVKTQPLHRMHVYRRNVQWFQFWLQGVEVEDPVDPDQYHRWRGLRDRRDEDSASDQYSSTR